MAWPLQIRLLLAATLPSSPFIALAVPGGQLAVLAKYENSALRVTESPFVAPRHHAGCHIEGFNAREFAQRHPLVEGASYKATGTMERVEVRRFPDAWGARSGKYDSTHHLRARSATRMGEKK